MLVYTFFYNFTLKIFYLKKILYLCMETNFR
jgi:hypothetical protein